MKLNFQIVHTTFPERESMAVTVAEQYFGADAQIVYTYGETQLVVQPITATSVSVPEDMRFITPVTAEVMVG
jgi:hypothetical protein